MKKILALILVTIFFLFSPDSVLAADCDYVVNDVDGLLSAKDTIRGLNNNMTKDIVVCLRGGDYFLNSTISFGPQDSGTNDHNIIYKNYDNNKPTIIGGQPITNWQRHSGNIYKANVGKSWKFYNLMENRTLSTMARHPNSGWLSAVTAPAYNQITYGVGDLPLFDYSDAQLSIKLARPSGNEYFAEVLPITSVNFGTRLITVNKWAHWWPFDAGTRYFARGSLDFLDQAGEYYLDESAGWLYYWPMNLPIADQEIVAPKMKRIIELVGSSSAHLVEHIKFENLVFRLSDFTKEHGVYYSVENNTDHAMIFMNNARNIEVRFCDLRFAGFAGVTLWEYAQNNTVYGTCIRDTGTHGVRLNGYAVGVLKYVNKSNTISNCYLANGALFWPQADAIYAYQSGNNEIVHNEIIHWPLNGIEIVSKNYATMKTAAWGTSVTWANHWDWLYTRDNNVAFNDISHVLENSSDGGGIHTFGTGKGNVINNNSIHDFTAGNTRNDATIGLYLDGDSSHITVTNNIIYGIGSTRARPIAVSGDHNLLDNNVIVDNPGYLDGAGNRPVDISFHLQNSAYPDAEYGHFIATHNILYRASGYYAYQGWPSTDSSDNNVFYHPGGSVRFYNKGNLVAWQALGYDAASIAADPLFTDPANHDYSLLPGSPALTLGITSIDQSSIGLLDDFPWDPDNPTPTPTPTRPPSLKEVIQGYGGSNSNLYLNSDSLINSFDFANLL